jgi:hypothetical protein
MAGFDISGVEPSGSATRELDLMETGCEDGTWMELPKDRVQWRVLVLTVWKLGVLLPDFYIPYYYYLICCS